MLRTNGGNHSLSTANKYQDAMLSLSPQPKRRVRRGRWCKDTIHLKDQTTSQNNCFTCLLEEPCRGQVLQFATALQIVIQFHTPLLRPFSSPPLKTSRKEDLSESQNGSSLQTGFLCKLHLINELRNVTRCHLPLITGRLHGLRRNIGPSVKYEAHK